MMITINEMKRDAALEVNVTLEFPQGKIGLLAEVKTSFSSSNIEVALFCYL